MFLRETTRKNKDGSTVSYLQLALSEWDKQRRRPVTKIIYSFGRTDDPKVIERVRRLARGILQRCSPEELTAERPDWHVVNAWPYGPVYVLEALWQRLGLAEILRRHARDSRLEFDVERALFAMVANRALAPCSKLNCWQQWLREDTWIPGTADLQLQHLYRALDFLARHSLSLQEEIFFRVSDLLNLEVNLIFYDTTSLHFEIDENDHDDASQSDDGPVSSGLRKRGYAKNGRSDAPQIVVGLAVTRDGLPVRHWIFPGNTVDVTTVKQVKKDLQGWQLGRCVFVSDAGTVSADNLASLALGGGKYITCMPVVSGGEVERDVLTMPGRYREVAENLRVKEVIVGQGERRRRYVVCHNPQEERRQRLHRAKVLQELEAELASLQDCGAGHGKRVCALRTSRRYGRYLRELKSGGLKIDQGAVRRAEKRDGRFVVHTNDDTLSPEDLALAYKQLMRVEEAWRTLKSGLKLRPVFHWSPQRIEAHVSLTVLALLLERVAEMCCRDTWRNIRDDLSQVKLAQLSGPDGEIWQVTAPRQAAVNRLQSLKIPSPPLILDHA
jgi:transposase